MKYPARIVIWPKMKSSSPEPEQSWVSGWYFTLGQSLYSDSPWFTPRPDKPIWRFPGMGVPPNHLFLMGLSIVKPSSYWGTPFSGNSHLRATYRPETPQRIMHSLPPHGAHVRRTGEIDTDGAIARLLDASCTVGSTIYSLRWIIVIMFLFVYIYIYMNIMYSSCYRRKFWNQTSDNMYRWSSRGGNSFYVAPRCFRCFSLRLSPFR